MNSDMKTIDLASFTEGSQGTDILNNRDSESKYESVSEEINLDKIEQS